MKQILQDIKNGSTRIVEVPRPSGKEGSWLIQTRASLISAGTERMLIDFGKAGYISKARQQPDKVRMVVDKIKTDGLLPTLDTIRSKLDQPLPLGYSNVGNVIDRYGNETGKRVVSNGHHAEFVSVPYNLCAEIPNRVSDEEASFTVLGAIALQGIRLSQPTLGELFVVTGLGLVGQLAVQLLLANGCRVLGIDLDSKKCRMAESFGAKTIDLSAGEEPIAKADFYSQGKGVDGVIITADTKSNDPIHQAALMCRKRGRVVLVGVTGLELNRSDFYEKELSFQVSCSYGPGRYDSQYEENGHDYPYGFVRWTEQRNFEAVLHMLETGKLNVKPLISHRFDFAKAIQAYTLIADKKEPHLGIVLNYNGRDNERQESIGVIDTSSIELAKREKTDASIDKICVAVIGAGNFSSQVVLPILGNSQVRLKTIVSDGGVSGTHQGQKYGFEKSTTDVDSVFKDSEVNTVFITTRHDSHYRLVIDAIQSDKHVFVEKPLCLSFEELGEIKKVYLDQLQRNPHLKLFVGFNRRFAPHIQKTKQLLEATAAPKAMVLTINAGKIPKDHWIQDPRIGGGRIIGEMCHFVDLLRFLSGQSIVKFDLSTLNHEPFDTVSANLIFADGSVGTIHYFSNGTRSFPKERLEVFSEGKILQMDNFKSLKGYGWKNFSKRKLWRQDKGHAKGIAAFLAVIESRLGNPIPFDEVIEVMDVSLKLAELNRK